MTSILGRMVTYSGKPIEWDKALNSEIVIAPVDDLTTFDDVPPVVPDENMNYPIPMPGTTKTV